MIEASGIRYIPKSKRIKIKGYKKSDEKLTYHHLIKKEYGGEASEKNGAILKEYNHVWLHQLPPEQQEEVNNKLREYKLSVLQLGYQETQKRILENELDFRILDLADEGVDYIVIQAYQDHRKQRKEEKEYAKELSETLNWR